MQKMLQQKTSWSSVTQSYQIPVQITSDLIKKIRYINSRISSQEWCAVLLYEKEGNWSTNDLTIKCVDLFPAFKAHGMSFDSEYPTFEVSRYILENYDLSKIHQGLIHSHCNSPVFFSGTDKDELFENANSHSEGYFSLITNNKLDFTALLGVRGYEIVDKTSIRFLPNSHDSVPIRTQYKKDILLEFQTKITLPKEDIPAWYEKRVNTIIKDYEDRNKLIQRSINKSNDYTGRIPNLFSDLENERYKVVIPSLVEEWESVLTDFLAGVDNSRADLNQIVKMHESSGTQFSETEFGIDALEQWTGDQVFKEDFETIRDLLSPFNITFTEELIKNYEKYFAKEI